MKTTPVPLVKGGSRSSAVALRRDAQLAYRARTPQALEDESEDESGLGLRARSIDSDYGPTVLLSARGERAGAPMLLLSTKLFQKLLATARAMGPPRPQRRRARHRLDIKV
jgi:hypothetical protein